MNVLKRAIVILFAVLSLVLNVNAEKVIIKYTNGSYELIDKHQVTDDSNVEYVQENFQYSVCF